MQKTPTLILQIKCWCILTVTKETRKWKRSHEKKRERDTRDEKRERERVVAAASGWMSPKNTHSLVLHLCVFACSWFSYKVTLRLKSWEWGPLHVLDPFHENPFLHLCLFVFVFVCLFFFLTSIMCGDLGQILIHTRASRPVSSYPHMCGLDSVLPWADILLNLFGIKISN